MASVEAALAALQAGDFDCVVGFGGGSPMDTAKAVAVLARHGGHMRDYKAPRLQDEPGLPIMAIPTTAGTGSEATRFTIVTDETSDEKMLCIGLAYLPVAALVDYELTLTKPERLTADTGIDALTHAIEAYVSRKSTRSRTGWHSRRCGDRAEPAPGLGRPRRPGGARGDDVRRDPGRHRLLEHVGRPGPRHEPADRPHFHVAHGLSNAMLLPAVTAYSAPAAVGALRRLRPGHGARRRRRGATEPPSTALMAGSRPQRRPRSARPREYGIDPARWEALIPTMAEQALASGPPANNPLGPKRRRSRPVPAGVGGWIVAGPKTRHLRPYGRPQTGAPASSGERVQERTPRCAAPFRGGGATSRPGLTGGPPSPRGSASGVSLGPNPAAV